MTYKYETCEGKVEGRNMKQEENHTTVEFCESFNHATVKSSIQSLSFEELHISDKWAKISTPIMLSHQMVRANGKGALAPTQQWTQRVSYWKSQSTILSSEEICCHGHLCDNFTHPLLNHHSTLPLKVSRNLSHSASNLVTSVLLDYKLLQR